MVILNKWSFANFPFKISSLSLVLKINQRKISAFGYISTIFLKLFQLQHLLQANHELLLFSYFYSTFRTFSTKSLADSSQEIHLKSSIFLLKLSSSISFIKLFISFKLKYETKSLPISLWTPISSQNLQFIV